jgi:uncharacterized protein (TIGR03435 family)
MPVYNLIVGKTVAKMTESTMGPEKFNLIMNLSPTAGLLARKLPAHSTTMERFASALQEGVLDRPVIDKTGLTGRYDFDPEFSVEGTLLTPSVYLPPIPISRIFSRRSSGSDWGWNLPKAKPK